MSGRLVILPKKTYCPWNPDNVERVLRDERLEKEKKKAEAASRQQEETQQRWDQMKRQKKGGNEDVDPPKHFSLFEEEEKKHCDQQLKPEKKKQVGILPLFLGESLSREQSRKAAKEARLQGKSYQQKESKRKKEMDPMRDFAIECNGGSEIVDAGRKLSAKENGSSQKQQACKVQKKHRHEDSSDCESSDSHRKRHKKRRNHKHRRRDDDSDSETGDNSDRRKGRRKHKRRRQETSDNDSDDEEPRKRRRNKKRHKRRGSSTKDNNNHSPQIDFAELRRRRLEREEKEKEREKEAIREASGGVRSQGRYQNQYFPRLSRN